MVKVTNEASWLGQDLYCRFLANESLTPKGEPREIARTCIALASEYFAVLELDEEATKETERKAQARALADALMVELRNPTNGKASEPPPAKEPALPAKAPEPAPPSKAKKRYRRRRRARA
jgi:hypothetical protein